DSGKGRRLPTKTLPTPHSTPDANSGAPLVSVSVDETLPNGFHCGDTSALNSGADRIPPPACKMSRRCTVPLAGTVANVRFGIQTVVARPAIPAPETPRK